MLGVAIQLIATTPDHCNYKLLHRLEELQYKFLQQHWQLQYLSKAMIHAVAITCIATCYKNGCNGPIASEHIASGCNQMHLVASCNNCN
jgi:hypothetical protein